MRGRRYLMLLMAAMLVWGAARMVPSALALASATVNFTGSLQAGQGTAFVTCTAPTTVAPNTPLQARGTATASRTITVSCTNNMNVAVNVSVVTGTITPSGGTLPTRAWNRTTIPLTAAGGASATATAVLTITANRFTTRTTYAQLFSTTLTASNGLDYSKSHSFTFVVQ